MPSPDGALIAVLVCSAARMPARAPARHLPRRQRLMQSLSGLQGLEGDRLIFVNCPLKNAALSARW